MFARAYWCKTGAMIAGVLSATAVAVAVPAVGAPALPNVAVRSFRHWGFMPESRMRSCGRRGPAIEGTTVEMSSSSVLENRGSGEFDVRNIPCSL